MPTSPFQSDVHINTPLTNVSIAYMQKAEAFIADKVFPRVPVKKQSDLYIKYAKAAWRRTNAQRRAPGTETVGAGWSQYTDSYFAHVYGVHKDIDDQTRANADSIFNLDADATAFVTNQLLLKRDLDWAATFFRTGVWQTDVTFTADHDNPTLRQWDVSTSDPILYFGNAQIEAIKNTGYKFNTLVLGANVLNQIKNHPSIIDRIKYTQKGIVSTDLLATLFDVEQVLVSYATHAVGPEIPDAQLEDAASEHHFISNPNSALFCHTAKSPGLQQPTAGYTFTWDQYVQGKGRGIGVRRFRMEHLRSDRVEAEMTYDMKVVSPDMGIFLNNVVGTGVVEEEEEAPVTP